MVEVHDVECSRLNEYYIRDCASGLAKKDKLEYLASAKSPGIKAQVVADNGGIDISCPCYDSDTGSCSENNYVRCSLRSSLERFGKEFK